jgi:hypothetical protein
MNVVYHLISTSVPRDAVNVAKDLCIKNNVQRFIFASSSSVN